MQLTEAQREARRENGRKGGLARAKQFTSESQRAARARVSAASNQANGRRGYQACVERYGEHFAARRLAAHRKQCLTPLERKVLKWLDAQWIHPAVEVEIVPGKIYADIVIDQHPRKLVVECDGAIWHRDDPLHGENRVARDQERDEILKALGYEVIHLPQADIDSGAFEQNLSAFLQGVKA